MARNQSMSFFGSLFDRPIRRRYVRSLNQNATNLVRRLSQSRLFLNSSRSGASPSSVPSSPVYPNVDTTRLLERESVAPSIISNESYDIATAPELNNLLLAETQCSSDVVVVCRSETPPPAYRDVIS